MESLTWMKLDALVALRLAMKHNETQEDHMIGRDCDKTSTSSDEEQIRLPSSNYQLLLDAIVKTII